MMIAFITFKSSLVPLFEGLWSSNSWEFEVSDFTRNRTYDLGIDSPSLWPTEPRLHVRSLCVCVFVNWCVYIYMFVNTQEELKVLVVMEWCWFNVQQIFLMVSVRCVSLHITPTHKLYSHTVATYMLSNACTLHVFRIFKMKSDTQGQWCQTLQALSVEGVLTLEDVFISFLSRYLSLQYFHASLSRPQILWLWLVYVVHSVTISVSVSVSVSIVPFCCMFLCHTYMCLCLFVLVCVSRSKLSLLQCLYPDSQLALSHTLSISISFLVSTFVCAPFALPVLSACARTNNAETSMVLQPEVFLFICLAPLWHGFLCSLCLLFVFFSHQQRCSYCGPINRRTSLEGIPALCDKTAWK